MSEYLFKYIKVAKTSVPSHTDIFYIQVNIPAECSKFTNFTVLTSSTKLQQEDGTGNLEQKTRDSMVILMTSRVLDIEDNLYLCHFTFKFCINNKSTLD